MKTIEQIHEQIKVLQIDINNLLTTIENNITDINPAYWDALMELDKIVNTLRLKTENFPKSHL